MAASSLRQRGSAANSSGPSVTNQVRIHHVTWPEMPYSTGPLTNTSTAEFIFKTESATTTSSPQSHTHHAVIYSGWSDICEWSTLLLLHCFLITVPQWPNFFIRQLPSHLQDTISPYFKAKHSEPTTSRSSLHRIPYKDYTPTFTADGAKKRAVINALKVSYTLGYSATYNIKLPPLACLERLRTRRLGLRHVSPVVQRGFKH